MSGVVAAIDLGSNSTRLLVTDAAGVVLERRAEITRLSAGLARTGRLSPDGVAATAAVLADYRRSLDALGVGAVRVVATAAARRATDSADALAQFGAVIGTAVEILSGDEEGRLSFRGATADLDPSGAPFLVVDIGGGSTELVVGGDGGEVVAAVSLDLGCVTLTETELHHDPPRPEELTNAIGTAADAFGDAWRQRPALRDATTVVGVAGTITTMAAIELGLARYDRDRVHGLVVDRAAAEDVFRTLATEPLADRIHNPGLPRDRAGVIVGGMCIVVALLRNLPADSLRVADADLLDALAADLRG